MLRLLFLFCLPSFCLAQSPGVVHDSVVCRKAPKESYSLYVPNGSAIKGVILFYDPSANGKLPVRTYQQLAKAYNLIIACSNNSRNGSAEASIQSGNAVLEDVLARFNVDRSFILVSGFSGGGRTAVQMAIGDSRFHGVIACGAAFPFQNAINKQHPVPFTEVIGRHDMNFQEAMRANQYLLSLPLPASLTLFRGGHQWPPAESFEVALRWHLLKNNRLSETDKIEEISRRITTINSLADSSRYFDALLMQSQLRSDFPESKPATRLEDPSLSKKISAGLREFEKASEAEQKMQEQIAYAYQQHIANAAPDSAYRESYWKQLLAEMNRMKSSGGISRSDAGRRLQDYGWRMCAERTFVFINYEQYRQAAMSARIWTILQPESAWAPLWAARCFARQKRKNETVTYLKLSIARGIDPKELNDPELKDYLKSASR